MIGQLNVKDNVAEGLVEGAIVAHDTGQVDSFENYLKKENYVFRCPKSTEIQIFEESNT